MSEYVVTLRSGLRLTVRADQVSFRDHQSVLLTLNDPGETVVAVFDRGDVAMLVAKDRLVSVETGDPPPENPQVVSRRYDDIPF